MGARLTMGAVDSEVAPTPGRRERRTKKDANRAGRTNRKPGGEALVDKFTREKGHEGTLNGWFEGSLLNDRHLGWDTHIES